MSKMKQSLSTTKTVIKAFIQLLSNRIDSRDHINNIYNQSQLRKSNRKSNRRKILDPANGLIATNPEIFQKWTNKNNLLTLQKNLSDTAEHVIQKSESFPIVNLFLCC